VQAAWFNSSPHHGLNRTMKVGKEEIMGALAAVETFFERRNYAQERRQWEAWLSHIGQRISELGGIRTQLLPPPGVNPHPVLNIEWDTAKYPVTAGELHRLFLQGEPRLMTHAEGEGNAFIVRAAGMKPGDEKLVAERMYAVFAATAGKPRAAPAPPAADIAGSWTVEIRFLAATARHRFQLETAGSRVSGSHTGQFVTAKLRGTVDGAQVTLRSELPFDSIQLPYNFRGRIEHGRMSGELDLEEHGTAAWSAVRS
jgi:L-seryl-tRNA(Ser) seleniumtransferase